MNIYALKDPETAVIRYVGKTRKTLAARLCGHLSDALTLRLKNHRCNWIRSLAERGLRPTIVLLEQCEDANEAECRWIKTLRLDGVDLVNSTDGGDGGHGMKPSEETLKKLSLIRTGKRMSEEARKHNAEARQGKKRPPEFGITMSNALRGRKFSESHLANMAAVRRGKPLRPETRAKISESMKKRTLAARLNETQ